MKKNLKKRAKIKIKMNYALNIGCVCSLQKKKYKLTFFHRKNPIRSSSSNRYVPM